MTDPGVPELKIIKLQKGVKKPISDDWPTKGVPSQSEDGQYIMNWVDKGYVNYGVVTGKSGLFIGDVDPKNGADAEKYLREWPATYTVRTPSGGLHFYYRWADSAKYTGKRNPRLDDGSLEPGIDFLVGNTYAVGPGSTVNGKQYEVIRDMPMAELSPPMIARFMTAKDHSKPASKVLESGLDVSNGRNNALAQAIGIQRKMGLSDDAVWPALVSMNESLRAQGVEPLSEHELRTTVYVSAMKWQESEPDVQFEIVGAEAERGYILGAEDLPFVGEKPIRWVVDDFIPEGELTIIWGAAKLGKSTFCAWVAAKASQQRRQVLFVGAGEERAEVFAAKFRESGGDMDYFKFANISILVKFPTHTKYFSDQIRDKQFGLIYFDSLRSSMEAADKKNEADRSRDALQPIATIAQEVGVTVLMTTHPTKGKPDMAEIMLGSNELKAVARCTLHARSGDAANNFFVTVDTTNMKKPDVKLRVVRGEKPFCDHRTGAVQTEVREDGTERVVTIPFIELVERIASNSEDEMPEQSPSTADFGERFEAFLLAWNSGDVRNEKDALTVMGMPKVTFYRYKKEMLRREGALQTEVA